MHTLTLTVTEIHRGLLKTSAFLSSSFSYKATNANLDKLSFHHYRTFAMVPCVCHLSECVCWISPGSISILEGDQQGVALQLYSFQNEYFSLYSLFKSCFTFLSTAKLGDNVLGSVRQSVRPSVCPSVCPPISQHSHG